MASAATTTGLRVPAGNDPFDPQGDMVELANSFGSRIVIPVPNASARAQLVAAIDWTPSPNQPLRIFRADATVGREHEYTTNGTRWTTYRQSVLAEYRVTTAASGAITETGWYTGIGNINTPGSRIRVTMSGQVATEIEAGSVYHIEVRLDTPAGPPLCILSAIPPALGGPGQITWTAITRPTIAPGFHALYLHAQRAAGTGTGTLRENFTVIVESDD